MKIKIGELKDVGKLNAFYVSNELEIGDIVTTNASAFFSNASEEVFKSLLNSFLSNNKFNASLFISYVAENGYYCTVLDKEVHTPKI